ncbi:hypothetical protein [uncultured Deefgea sp.]|uniref:hypothetical protein n=1 Tax=uncultured Deefgea sp. TaxID=1304914 RepID=UPI0025978DCB|nr:hypothetical protein [uncultured Deefgea sp.]
MEINFLDLFCLYEKSKSSSEEQISIGDDVFFSENGVEIVFRLIDNGDFFVFVKVLADVEFNILLSDIYSEERMDALYKSPSFDPRYGYNKTTGWNSLVRAGGFELLLSKRYSYRRLESETSFVYEFVNETIFDVNSLGGVFCEKIDCESSFSFLFSNDVLFDDMSKDAYLTMFYRELYVHNASSSTWYHYDALITKTAQSIIPFTEDGYQISIHHSSKKEIVPLYQKFHSRFFYNIIYNAAFTITNYQKNVGGVFFTTFTSSWLKRTCGMVAPYIDTRLNETFINTLSLVSDFLPESLNSNFNLNAYADFLVEYHKNGTLFKSTNGVFFPDYFSIDQTVLAHTSLNHQLGILSHLFRRFSLEPNEQYQSIYSGIVSFIVDTKDNWINVVTGDLNYGLSLSSGEYIYSGGDYKYVTLADLLLCYKNHISFFGSDCPELLMLIKVKLQWLDLNGFGVFDPFATIASGEGEGDKKRIRKLLKELSLCKYVNTQFEFCDLFFDYSYFISRSLSYNALMSFRQIQYVKSDEGAIFFCDPIVKFWSYCVCIKYTNSIYNSSYFDEPVFKFEGPLSKIKTIEITVKDIDDGSVVGVIHATPAITYNVAEV